MNRKMIKNIAMTLAELGLDADDYVQYVRGTLEDASKVELLDKYFNELEV